ncbi:MAG: hypothetical protein ABJO36_09960 [Litorimonas sp.]
METNDPQIHKEPTKPKLAMKPLKEHASKTVKVLWTGVGALATLGGVVGLLQVFSANNAGGLSAGASSQDVLMEMVKSGDIDVADAERLAELLYGEDGQSDSEGLKDIAEGGTARQKKAIAMLAERHTREEGLTLLEAEAKTGADWRLVAELAYGFDAKRALSAVKKAIALDPEDFRAVTLMSQIHVRTGDFSSAQRSAKTAELLATTTAERLMAARSSLSILVSATNVTDIPLGIENLKSAMEPNALDVETTPLPTKFDTIQDAEIHPLYLQAVSSRTLATASLYVADYPSVKLNSENALRDYVMVMPRVPSEDRAKMKSRIAAVYDNLIYVEFIGKNWPEMMSLARKQLDLYREAAEIGDKRAQTALPGKYAQYAGYAVYSGEKDIVRSASQRSLDLTRLAADRRPDDARLALNVGQVELNHAILMSSIGEDVDISASLDKMMTGLEEALRGQPDESKNSPWTRYSSLMTNVVGYYGRDDVVFDEDPSEAIMARAESFLDSEIASRPEAHDPRHARNSLYLTMGDYLKNAEDVEGAKKAYRRAFDDSAEITPTETEPDVVALSEFVALQRLVALEEDGIETKDKPELREAIELGQRLNREGKLTTPYQPVLSYLIALRDDTLPDYEAAQSE